MPVSRVHLHEVGAIDSIVDIVGAVFGFEWFAVDRVVCSPLNVGGGMVKSAHGLFPVPAPATVNRMSVDRVGYGAGDSDFDSTPNVLRVLIGRSTDQPSEGRVVVLECEIDDMNPQIFGVAMDRLYEAGALDVFYVSVQMKKNRPGTLLTVIAPPELRAKLVDVVFRETTTIGLRHHEVDRECLRREIVTVQTPIGPVRFKLAWYDGKVVNAAPEFEDCVALASTHNLSVKEVQALAVRAYGGARPVQP
jgi:uncharacterized protein (DUF111 family)